MLTVTDMNARLGGRLVLENVDLEIPDGRVTLLIGHNGSGKTTLARCMCGLEHNARGSVRLDGKELAGTSATERARLGLLLVPQGRGIFADVSVRDHFGIMRGQAARGRPAESVEAATEEALKLFPELRRAWKKRAGELSGGQQQQLSLSRALLYKVRVLVFDEPSVGLSPRLVGETMEFISRLKTAGRSILLIEQNVSRALKEADLVCALKRGRMVASDLDPAELSGDKLAELF
jgi:ABC-type branched-subunit amino acid transport system ATPase component